MAQRQNINTPMIQQLQKDMLEFASQWSTMKNEWDDMKKKVEKSEQKQDMTDKKIDRILHILENDDAIGQKGLVHEVNQNTIFRSKSLTQVKLIAVIASSLVALGFGLLKSILIK